MTSTLPLAGRDTCLARIAGPGGVDITVRAFQNSVITDDALSIGDLVECDYSGYAPLTSNLWTGPTSAPNGDRYLLAPVFTFSFGSGFVTNTARGYFLTLTISGTPHLLWARNLPSPVNMYSPGAAFSCRPKISVRALIF